MKISHIYSSPTRPHSKKLVRKSLWRSLMLFSVSFVVFGNTLSAATIVGGKTVFTLKKDNPTVSGLYQFEDYFDDTVPYNYIIDWDSTEGRQKNSSNITYGETTLNGQSYVVLTDPIRPNGVVAPVQQGRNLPITNLQFDTENFSIENLFTQWGTSTADPSGMFVTFSSSSEIIALTNMTRWKPLGSTGSLINGDFALAYDPSRASGSRSGLLLVSHASGFNPFLFADLGNITIDYDSLTSQLSLTGDVLIAGGVTYWDGFVTNGLNLGTFGMIADIQAIPEPSTWSILIGGVSLLAIFGRRKRIRTT